MTRKQLFAATASIALLIGTAAVPASAAEVKANVGGIGANVTTGGGGANANASLGGGGGANASVSLGGGDGGNANVNIGGDGGANADISIGGANGGGAGGDGASGIGNSGGDNTIAAPEAVRAALADLSPSEQAALKKRCVGILADPGGYEDSLVILCQVLRKL